MAGEYKNNISLGIKLKPTSEVQSELTTAIEQLQKNSSIDLKIDTSQINQSLKDFSENLNNISNQIKNNFNFGSNFTTQASGVESVTNKLKEEQQVAEQTANVIKTLSTTTTGKSDSNGNITEALKTVEQLQTGIGNTTRLTTDLATGLKTASNTENFQKLDNIVDNLQTKLSKSSNNKFINESVITELQTKLNGINTNTAEKEIKELQTTINNIGSSDNQIVRLQSTISKMENNLTNMKGKYGNLVGDSSSKSSLDAYISEIEKLKTLMNSLQNGGTISCQKLASELNLGTEASRNLSTSVKNSSNAFRMAQKDASSLGDILKSTLANTGLYMGTYQAIQMLVTQMKNAYEYSVYMDKAFTDMNITMELTKEQFTDMSGKIQQMGVAYGNSSKTVMDIARVYANATTDLDTIMSKIKPDLWLANVSRMDGSQVTKTVQSMTNQFKLMSKEGLTAEDATTKIGNSLVTVSKNMAFDFTSGIKELTEAVKTSGSVAEASGQSMESYLSMAGAFIEQTGKSGDEFAQSYKMISARILQQKELGNELGISTDEMADAEKALSKYDISTRSAGGNLRNLDDILKDTSTKFATMSDSDKQFIANKLAGVRQTSSFIAIMESMNRQQNIYNKTQTDTTSLYDAQQKYAESLEGKLGSLKATYEGLISKMTNSDFLKSAVVDLTSILNVIGSLDGKTIAFIGTIGLATVAISKLVTMNKTLMAVQTGEGIATGFTHLLGILTGMTPLIGTTTVATEAFTIAQTEATIATDALAVAETRLLVAKEALTIAQEGQSTSSFAVAVAEGEVMLATDALTVAQGEATIATEALTTAQAEMIAEEAGLTGLSGAWTLVSTSIKGAVTSSLAFLATPLGMVISALAITVGVAVGAFASYKKEQAELEQQSKTLKDALEGVNNALKGGDTTKAKEEVNKIKEQQKALQDLIAKKKELEALPDSSAMSDPTGSGFDKTSQLNDTTDKINKLIKALRDGGATINETTGEIENLVDAESKIANTEIVNKIKEQTKAQVEHRTNTEANTNEYNKYIKTTQELYSQYQNLSAQENLSTEQKKELTGIVEQLQGKIGNLDVQMDANGKTYITNTGLISDTISYLNTEGQTVETLTQVKLADEKSNATWQYNNTAITYADTVQRIADYKAEILAIQQLMQARMVSTTAMSTKEVSDSKDMTDTERARHMNSAYVESSVDQAKINEQNDAIAKLQAGKDVLDKLYSSSVVPVKAPSGGGVPDYTPEGSSKGGGSGKSAEEEAKKAQEELVKNEKQMLTDITDAYNQAKDKIDDDINAIDTSLQLLGDADDSNFTQRVDLTTQKIAKQKDEVTNASDQLQKLKDTTVTTAEAQKELESATLKASKELRTQTLEASKLQKELEKTTQEEIKVNLEKQKEIDTETLEAQQKAQTDRLDAIKTQQETLHQDRLNALEDESKALDEQSKALDEQNTATERATELEKEKTDLLEKQKELTNLESKKTVKTLKQNSDNTWSYVGEVDTTAVTAKKKEVDTAQATLDETNRKNALEDAKKEIEDKKSVIEAEKTAEDTAYDKKKSYLDKYSDDLKEAQERDKKRIETHYSDIDTLSKDTLKQLETEYNNNWDAIAEHIATTLTATKKQLDDLTTLSANFTVTDADNAINSGDVSSYLEKNKSKMADKAKVDENEINNNLKNIDVSAKVADSSIDDLTESYKDLLSVKNDNEITNEDITSRKSQVQEITKIDSDGLSTSLKNLQDADKKLETEQDTHYKTELTRQNKAQDDELASLKKFTESYLLVTNKFLELLQVVYDFRFNNITTIVSGAVSNILEALIQTEADYEKFAEMWNKMHGEDDQIPSSVDISSNVSGTASYKQSTMDYQTGKLSLYTADAFEKYASEIGNGISESLLSKLSNYSASVGGTTSTSNSSTVNNKNTSSSNTTSVVINGVTVNADNAETFLTSLLTKAKQTSVLKSTN